MNIGLFFMIDNLFRNIFFGDFMQTEEETTVYDEIPDTKLLTKSMEHYLKELQQISIRLRSLSSKMLV